VTVATRFTPFTGQVFTLSDEPAEPPAQRSYCDQISRSFSQRYTYFLNESTDLINRVCNCFDNLIWDELADTEEEEDIPDVHYTVTIRQLPNEVLVTYSERVFYE
jgi:hypothetical protein